MSTKLPKNTNHPRKGSTIKVEPIRDVDAILTIKTMLACKPRDLCLFVLGVNTAYRANELLSLTCGQVAHLQPGDVIDLKQRKTKKHRSATLNHAAAKSIRQWLAYHPGPSPDAPLFISRSGKALSVPTLSNMAKAWCADAGLLGNYGSHTLRKTWGYHQLRRNKETKPQMVLPILMHAYGHTSQEQTLDYLCIQSDEVASLFMQVEL
ncbi:MAG: tyrosine-type recombinase/integrase [Parvularculaceae bacterium]